VKIFPLKEALPPKNGISVGGTWREGSFTGNSESYIRHVKESLGNGASLS